MPVKPRLTGINRWPIRDCFDYIFYAADIYGKHKYKHIQSVIASSDDQVIFQLSYDVKPNINEIPQIDPYNRASKLPTSSIYHKPEPIKLTPLTPSQVEINRSKDITPPAQSNNMTAGGVDSALFAEFCKLK
jgi:hypothetical protein